MKKGTWKHDIFTYNSIKDVITEECLEGMFQMLKELSKPDKVVRSKRIYIGPGRDGSSNDKIAVEVKILPRTTKVTVPDT